MTDADLQAIAAYLKFLGGNPPLQAYDVQAQQKTEAKADGGEEI